MNNLNNNKKESSPDKEDKSGNGNRVGVKLPNGANVPDNPGQKISSNTSENDEDGSNEKSYELIINCETIFHLENTIAATKIIEKFSPQEKIVAIANNGKVRENPLDPNETIELEKWNIFEIDRSDYFNPTNGSGCSLFIFKYEPSETISNHQLGKIQQHIQQSPLGTIKIFGRPNNNKNGEIGENKILIGYESHHGFTASDIKKAICDALDLEFKSTKVKVSEITF